MAPGLRVAGVHSGHLGHEQDVRALRERQKTVTDLTAATGGVCCLLDTETGIFDICWLNGQMLSDETVPGARFPRFHDLVAAWREPVQ